MKLTPSLLLQVSLGAAAACGSFYAGARHAAAPAAPVREVLYWQDPMHPQYRSDKPGLAPDCGMALEPVYAARSPQAAEAPGAVSVSPEGIAFAGIRTVAVGRGSIAGALDVRGVVAADESRVYRVTALADGVVRSVAGFAPGSTVHREDRLATYFVPTRDMFNAVQAYVLANGAFDQAAAGVRDRSLIDTARAQTRVEEELLRTYGVGSQQIREIARTREVTRDIDLRAPATGVVLSRGVTAGEALARGAEVARIADLSRVWVLADVAEADIAAFRPGAAAKVRYGGLSLPARVSEARQFDGAARVFKVRLELANPGMALRPEMWVRVSLPAPAQTGIAVPEEAVLDHGTHKVAFVRVRDGVFVPREVTTGPAGAGSVRILSGLREGEEVAASGTFLLDGESRLRAARFAVADAETAAVARKETDPVCGMPLDKLDETLAAELDGWRVHFCSRTCKSKFDRDPGAFRGHAPVASASQVREQNRVKLAGVMLRSEDGIPGERSLLAGVSEARKDLLFSERRKQVLWRKRGRSAQDDPGIGAAQALPSSSSKHQRGAL